MSRSINTAVGTGHGAAAPAQADPLSAVLVDREPARLAALTSALEQVGIVTVAAETTFAAASAAIAHHAPSVVVLDTGLEDGSTPSFEIVERLRQANAELKLVCLGEAESRTALGRIFRAGADAVFLRRSSPPELARAVSRLLRDDSLFVPVAEWAPGERGGKSPTRSSPAVRGRRVGPRLARPAATRPGECAAPSSL